MNTNDQFTYQDINSYLNDKYNPKTQFVEIFAYEVVGFASSWTKLYTSPQFFSGLQNIVEEKGLDKP